METNKSILHAVASALSAGQSARIDVSGLGDGKVKVIYTPQIGETPEGASQEVINLRAAIARPFVVTGNASEIKDAFAARLQEKAAVVSRGLNALDEIDRLAQAARSTSKPAAAAAPAQASVATDDDEERDDESAEGGAAAPAGTAAEAAPQQKPTSIAEQF
ncbi:PRTRC system protein E [Pseudomonas aeruginosa]|jgi:PRTRC genetic system protein E|uniref:PRTRC system protein E n=1 Tax=Pseudomonas aeruginosa TaxID=287 RepID=UPI001A26DBC1|nr:PRTRC system protein E [Pseudomonas aeruginosa]EKV0397868.1 PRTRC system protein E [Pseudomonas aeruginosa]EKV3012849.1 PRTRC system protein E [Pseudomonas aeruginosa]MBH4318534.1 PRTRC system protein E [Pseudomonas aeruginosa]MBH8701111.1 PRTRC system protein E [Pseudomonas aeruginosa]WBM10778.1 PRTRC system protein E [Pseudomonas aeruginosa]